MANGDYGYFGKGETGHVQYMTAFNRMPLALGTLQSSRRLRSFSLHIEGKTTCPSAFIIAENDFLTCLCKSGADIAQLYNDNMDAVTMTTLLFSPTMIFLLKILI